MTDTFNPDMKPALGIGGLISNSFSLYFRNFVPFFLMAFVPILITNLITNGMMGDQILAMETGQVTDPFGMFTAAYFITTFLSFLVFFIVLSLLTLAAYDAHQGKRMNFGGYVNTALRALVPIVVLSIIAIIATYVGFIFVFLPGLYIMAMFSVMTPAILVEKVGFRGLGRSMALTKHYRWPTLGAWIVIGIIALILSIPVAIAIGFFASTIFETGHGIFALSLVSALTGAVGYGIMSVFAALLYARLREIKEGVGIEDLSEIFA